MPTRSVLEATVPELTVSELLEPLTLAVPVATPRDWYLSMGGERRPLSTSDTGIISMIRRMARDGMKLGGDEFDDACRELAAAADERDRLIQEAREKHADPCLPQVQMEAAQQQEVVDAIVDEILEHKVASLAELVEKIDWIEEAIGGDQSEYVFADVRRLREQEVANG